MEENRKRHVRHTPPHEHAPDTAVLDQIALGIAPGGQNATPAHCINDYAESLARDRDCSLPEAVHGIRTAFHERYGMTPEEYADRPARRQARKDEAVARAVQKTTEKQNAEKGRDSDDGRSR